MALKLSPVWFLASPGTKTSFGARIPEPEATQCSIVLLIVLKTESSTPVPITVTLPCLNVPALKA